MSDNKYIPARATLDGIPAELLIMMCNHFVKKEDIKNTRRVNKQLYHAGFHRHMRLAYETFITDLDNYSLDILHENALSPSNKYIRPFVERLVIDVPDGYPFPGERDVHGVIKNPFNVMVFKRLSDDLVQNLVKCRKFDIRLPPWYLEPEDLDPNLMIIEDALQVMLDIYEATNIHVEEFRIVGEPDERQLWEGRLRVQPALPRLATAFSRMTRMCIQHQIASSTHTHIFFNWILNAPNLQRLELQNLGRKLEETRRFLTMVMQQLPLAQLTHFTLERARCDSASIRTMFNTPRPNLLELHLESVDVVGSVAVIFQSLRNSCPNLRKISVCRLRASPDGTGVPESIWFDSLLARQDAQLQAGIVQSPAFELVVELGHVIGAKLTTAVPAHMQTALQLLQQSVA